MSELPSTYFVYDQYRKEELKRLTLQDQMVTTAMGGVLSEQLHDSVFHRVLDIGCGTGGWGIEAAKSYSELVLTGIDISHQMIEYARGRARADKVSGRVNFQVMDALHPLEFSSESFDVVNLRFGVSFIRTWEWPQVIAEMLRVAKVGGIVRITDSEIMQTSSSPALKIFQEMVLCALQRAGYLFGDEALGITTHLAPLLQRYGVREVQTKAYITMYEAGTTEGKLYIEDVSSVMKTLKPFILRWGCADQVYEEICQMARGQMARPDFYSIWQLLTAWGVK